MKFYLVITLSLVACQSTQSTAQQVVKPVIITDTVRHDTDDPAIWINPADHAKSLIIGTDKDQDGGLYVFDLNGKIVKEVHDLKRPNNVDIAYSLKLAGKPTDIAVTTERFTHKLRIFSLPDMQPIDKGGLDMFVGDTTSGFRDLMGIALYKAPSGILYAMVGRKTGPTTGSYIGQYKLEDDGSGHVKATLVRKFGTYSGKKEIESIAVDNELGYVYYSDEGVGVRKYYADPERGNNELALFAKTGFAEDHEGISIYKTGPKTGYLLVSDQGANQFHIFRREGEPGHPNEHKLLKVVKVAAQVSDGSDVTNVALGKQFPHGLFVAMSEGKTFHYYRWEDIAGKDLK
ncbi:MULTISPECIES: phytase [unclassified Spirosoma]|uniref:phytase n=1 Tax=unclassified Spirosoma TaxID=2621999 RepID=UPI00096800FB|nr:MULTISPECIES: phytase [unclassified Spirosoma]MBN8822988.1 phytase [Spirosoma sp.]OJW73094.1 MAG: 3-phytase [Spirosoma sp. 48-14]